jgi:DNA-binding NarL/FixJ family response regulator
VTRVYLVCRTCLYRESLASHLKREFEVVGAASDAFVSLAEIRRCNVDVVLLDADARDSISAVRAVLRDAPDTQVVVLGMTEDDRALIAFAEAGISGYFSREASIGDLVSGVRSVARGELLCSPRMAATLLRRVRSLARTDAAAPTDARLTARQLEIVDLIEQGLSNKEIARCLRIELPTVKNHLHSIYERLGVHGRGEAAARARRQGLMGRRQLAQAAED